MLLHQLKVTIYFIMVEDGLQENMEIEKVQPEDLLLLIVAYNKNVAEEMSKIYYRYKEANNITQEYVHLDLTTASIYRAFLYSSNLYVLQLPPETRYKYFLNK